MPPAFLIRWLGEKAARIVLWIVGALIALAIIVGFYLQMRSYFTADLTARVKVLSKQNTATNESAADAVNTVSNVADADTVTEVITRENTIVIDKTKGADARVDPALRAAGLQSLCRRASYRSTHPTCMQQPRTR